MPITIKQIKSQSRHCNGCSGWKTFYSEMLKIVPWPTLTKRELESIFPKKRAQERFRFEPIISSRKNKWWEFSMWVCVWDDFDKYSSLLLKNIKLRLLFQFKSDIYFQCIITFHLMTEGFLFQFDTFDLITEFAHLTESIDCNKV